MKKTAIVGVIGIVICAILISVVSASINLTKISIKTDYNAGEVISGKFKLVFENQTNELFTSSIGGSKSLLDLLSASGFNSGTDFECLPRDCKPNYSPSEDSNFKSIEVGGEKKVYGFVVNRRITEIRNLSFKILSDSDDSCLNQLYMDLFDDGVVDFYNTNYTLNDCGNKDYGCFDESKINGEGEIQPEPYCQKITLPGAPAYKIGAKIKNSTRNGILKMELYPEDSPGNRLGFCTLPSLTLQTQERDCIVNYTSTGQFNALICVSVNNDNTDYKINLAGGSQKCGRIGNENAEYTTNYQIYASPLKYGKIEKIFDSNLYSKLRPDSDNGLLTDSEVYLSNRYGNNCENGCVIPIAFSGQTQIVNVSDIEVKYDSESANGLKTSSIYKAGTKKVSLSSLKNLLFNFEALDIKIPSYSGSKKFELFFGLDSLTSEQINIASGFDFGLFPRYAYIGQNIPFEIQPSNNVSSIKSSTWEFGDGTTGQVNGSKISHVYSSGGDYDVRVRVLRYDGANSTKTFKISVGNIYESTRLRLLRDESRINNLTLQVKALDEWIRDDVEKKAGLNGMRTQILDIRSAFDRANQSNSAAMSEILNQLIKLDVPYSIIVSKKGTDVPLTIGMENADMSYIRTLSSGGEEMDDSELRGKIVDWMGENYNAKISFEVVSKFGDLGVSPVLTKFSISASPKSAAQGYLIIDYPLESIKFKDNVGAKPLSNGAYLSINDAQTILFEVPGSVKIEEIGAYISPEIKNLEGGGILHLSLKEFNWTVFSIGLIILLILAGLAFYFGRRWYIYNYEKHLFNNPRDLYNLISFIVNARNKGLQDSEIKKKLKSVGWTMEQVSYAMSKIKFKSKIY